MKIAYFFISPFAALYRLSQIILPELEAGTHSLNVVAMCFFDDNNFILDIENDIGLRLAKVAREKNITLLQAERVTSTSVSGLKEKNILMTEYAQKPTECVVITIADGQQVGCFPNFYAAVGDNPPERLISL